MLVVLLPDLLLKDKKSGRYFWRCRLQAIPKTSQCDVIIVHPVVLHTWHCKILGMKLEAHSSGRLLQ